MNEPRWAQTNDDDIARLVADLSLPEAYPWTPAAIEVIETHISWVFLAGDRVVKVKRPVDLGFVDHTSLAARRRSCLDEVQLNRRLTHDVYRGIVPIAREDGGYRIGDLLDPDATPADDPAAGVEWGVLMRRLPAHRMLDQLLRSDSAPPNLAERLAERLIPFHRSILSCGAATQAEGVAAMTTAVVMENLDQLAPFAGDPLGAVELGFAVDAMRGFVAGHGDLFRDRAVAGSIREGHGDLRCEHVCLDDEWVQIFDCVEFSREIRCADVASDLAFLLMDLARLGRDSIGQALVARYRSARFDLPDALLRFYRVHRALVRAKVACMEQAGVGGDAARRFGDEAVAYLHLATAQALTTRPSVIVMTGLSGTGKSTVARAIARSLDLPVVVSDTVRKELAGQTGPAPADWGQGLYAASRTTQTYERLRARAHDTLAAGTGVILDATFLDEGERTRVASLADAAEVPFVLVETVCDPETALARIRERAARGGSSSDATEAIYRRQRQEARDAPTLPPRNALHIVIDTGTDGSLNLDPLFAALSARGLIGSALRVGADPTPMET